MDKNEIIVKLYEELGREHRYFIDWRFKILTRFYIVLAAGAAATKWLLESDFSVYAFIPLVLVGLSSIGAVIMDKRSSLITSMAEKKAQALEEQLEYTGFFTEFNNISLEKYSYGRVLHGTYVASAWISLSLGLILVLNQVVCSFS